MRDFKIIDQKSEMMEVRFTEKNGKLKRKTFESCFQAEMKQFLESHSIRNMTFKKLN